MIKYAVYPSEVESIYDEDIHFISSSELMRLYRVDARECIVVDHSRPEALRGFDTTKLINLTPRYSGNYSIKRKE